MNFIKNCDLIQLLFKPLIYIFDKHEKMLQYFFHIYFVSLLYVTILLKYGISQEDGIRELGRFSSVFRKQRSEPLKRTCNSLLKLDGDVCKNEKAHLNVTKELTFSDIKYLPGGALRGFLVQVLCLDDPGVTVDVNVFDGILMLLEFKVKRSSIKVSDVFKNYKI